MALKRTLGAGPKKDLWAGPEKSPWWAAQGSRAEPKNTAAITVLPPLLPLPSSLPLLYHCYRHCNTLEHLCHLLYRHRQDASHRCCPQPRGWHCMGTAPNWRVDHPVLAMPASLYRSPPNRPCIHMYHCYVIASNVLPPSPCKLYLPSPLIRCTAAISLHQLYCRHLFALAVLPPSLRFSCTAAYLIASAVLPPSPRISCTAAVLLASAVLPPSPSHQLYCRILLASAVLPPFPLLSPYYTLCNSLSFLQKSVRTSQHSQLVDILSSHCFLFWSFLLVWPSVILFIVAPGIWLSS